jgi:hypothetical protein
MKIIPISSVYRIGERVYRNRAFMKIEGEKHTIVDMETGEQHECTGAAEAWEMHGKLNKKVDEHA